MYYQKLKNIYHLSKSFLANTYYKFPAKDLIVIGVTGTNGKTTTVHAIYHILNSNGVKTGMITSLSSKTPDFELDHGLHVTTPEPLDLPKILYKMKASGVNYVVLESTSSGLDQNRLFGINYDSSVITNIDIDHLDYHKTWENYAKAKYKIIKKTKQPNGLVVLNADHKKSANWLKTQKLPKNIVWCSKKNLKSTSMSVDGLKFKYKNTQFNIPIIGEYNYLNLQQAIETCSKYIPLQDISKALESFKTPLGRMQIMQTKPFSVIIDFAHTPSSLEEALLSISQIKPQKSSKVISVFGCAGERDPERRKMGNISAKYSDITILTIEDPRTENLRDINSEIIKYSKLEDVQRFETEEDYKQYNLTQKELYAFDYASVGNRKDAIDLAFKVAQKGDIIFITGKGHETSLAIGKTEHFYTDQETVLKILKT